MTWQWGQSSNEISFVGRWNWLLHDVWVSIRFVIPRRQIASQCPISTFCTLFHLEQPVKQPIRSEKWDTACDYVVKTAIFLLQNHRLKTKAEKLEWNPSTTESFIFDLKTQHFKILMILVTEIFEHAKDHRKIILIIYCVRSIRLECQNKYFLVWTSSSVNKSIILRKYYESITRTMSDMPNM